MDIEDVIFIPVVLALGAVVLAVVRRFFAPREWRLLTWAWLAHLAAGFAQIIVYRYYYPGGDVLAYHSYGVIGADALGHDFERIFPELVKAFFQQEDVVLPFELLGGGSTGTMSVIGVLLAFFLGGSVYACSLLVAIGSFASKAMIYRALRPEFAPEHHQRLMLAIMLVPSAVFWTSTMLKEPVVMVFMGPLFLAFRWLLDGRRLFGVGVLVAVGGIGVALLKAYLLLTLVFAAALWIVWGRALKVRGTIVVRPQYLVAAGFVVVLGMSLVGRIFPRLSMDKVADSMADQRRVSGREEGGSNYYLEARDIEDDSPAGRSIASQLLLAPFALATALFRPVLFEARNAMQALNALESTWIIVLTWQVFRRNRSGALLRRLTASPALMFCFAFTMLVGLGTGLSSANLGSLSRYRAPMMPFFFIMLLVLRQPERVRATTAPLAAATTEQFTELASVRR